MRKRKYYINQILSLLIFICIFTYAILNAYGYKLDFRRMKVVSSSVLDMSTNIDHIDIDTRIYLDNKIVANKTPINLRNIPIEYYILELRKKGYYTWTKNIQFDDVRVTSYRDIYMLPLDYKNTLNLYAKDVDTFIVSEDTEKIAILKKDKKTVLINNTKTSEITKYTDTSTIDLIEWVDKSNLKVESKNDVYYYNIEKAYKYDEIFDIDNLITWWGSTKNEKKLVITNSNEIRNKKTNKLLARFMNNIEEAFYINKGNTVLYTTDKDITLCDIDIENCIKLNNKDPGTKINYIENGKILYFILDNNLYSLIL